MHPLREPRRVAALRTQVGNRDGWVCWRCNQPIDPHLRYPHPLSATLEHKLNLCDHPEAAYDPAHCTVSHQRCNASAGATDGNRRRSRTLETSERW